MSRWRSRRDRGVPRATTISRATMRRERRLARREFEPFRVARALRTNEPVVIDGARPRTRGECIDGPRPCPWVACRHHLYLDVNPVTGTIKLNRPELEVDQLDDSCSLDIADRGEHTLEAVGVLLNLTRERIRQVEIDAYFTLTALSLVRELHA